MEQIKAGSYVMEFPGIGLENESSLHSSIKQWYAKPGDRLEVKIDGSIADIFRENLIIEIQTSNFTAIRKKLYKLVKNHPVHLVHPVPVEKYIVHISPEDGHIISRRKSPKHGTVYDLFSELVRMPFLINEANFSLEILLIIEEDILCDDGKGGWRRRGSTPVDKRLIDVVDSVQFSKKEDFLRLLPDDLERPFTNKGLSNCLKFPVSKAQKMTYCLKKMEVIKEVGKKGNQLIFDTKV